MQKGNDITFVWRITDNKGVPVDLSKFDELTISIQSANYPYDTATPLFIITDNGVRFVFDSADQKTAGYYNLILMAKLQGKDYKVDHLRAFELTAHATTHCVIDDADHNQVITTCLSRYLDGRDGRSPYVGDNGNWYEYHDLERIFKDSGKPSKGNAFTFDDFSPDQIAALQKPATDAAALVDDTIEASKVQTDAAKKAAAYAKEQGDAAQQQGDTARQQGELAQSRGAHAANQGDTAERQGNVTEQQGVIAEQQGDLAEQRAAEALNATQACIDATGICEQSTIAADLATERANTAATTIDHKIEDKADRNPVRWIKARGVTVSQERTDGFKSPPLDLGTGDWTIQIFASADNCDSNFIGLFGNVYTPIRINGIEGANGIASIRLFDAFNKPSLFLWILKPYTPGYPICTILKRKGDQCIVKINNELAGALTINDTWPGINNFSFNLKGSQKIIQGRLFDFATSDEQDTMLYNNGYTDEFILSPPFFLRPNEACMLDYHANNATTKGVINTGTLGRNYDAVFYPGYEPELMRTPPIHDKIFADGSPTYPPLRPGQKWYSKSPKAIYESVDNQSVTDWIKL